MTDYIAGDWGTTRLRLFHVEEGRVADRLDGPGIGALDGDPGEYLRPLLDHFGLSVPVLLCGMAGSRNGLAEAPYVRCPVTLEDWRAATLRLDFHDRPLRIAAGVRMDDRDVMRGEETQVFGALALDPALGSGRQLVLLPGTHSKWVWVEQGVITAFRTWFTGELFALLTTRSTLMKAQGQAGDDVEAQSGWREGLVRAQQGAGVTGSLFEARAAQLLRGESTAWAEGFLSGFLIGSEIEEGRSHGGLPDCVTLIGAPQLADRYAGALTDYGVEARRLDGEHCVLAGLELLHDFD